LFSLFDRLLQEVFRKEKTVMPEQAYEVYKVENHPDYGGIWTWYVLKKYQTPERETQNEYARWLCFFSVGAEVPTEGK
jgi:hypothetical protein